MDEAFLSDLLECSVCLEQLDSSSKVLPCQHTFCKKCLEEIVLSHKELRCPECRVLVEVKVDDLPCNILLIRLLEGIKNNPKLKAQGSTSYKRTEPSSRQSSSPCKPLEYTAKQGPLICAERLSLPKQVLQSSPCAKAIYTYEGKDPGDLSFKKGDMIMLQKRIDQNWYQGEVNGKCGFLPARYVQVIIPLPTHIPQCKALYDFSIGDNDAKDCLSFKKGEVITIIRRVDDNWAEGKLAGKIGIFPISFVEMNVAARSLMKLSFNAQPNLSRVVPPTPTSEVSQKPAPCVAKFGTNAAGAPAHSHGSLSSATSTPSPSSSTTSPNTPSLSSSSSSSTSLSLASVFPSLGFPVLTRSASQRSRRQHEKRHSLSSFPPCQKTPRTPNSLLHSLEIISTSGGDLLVSPNSAISGTNTQDLSFSLSALPSEAENDKKEDLSARLQRHTSSRDKINTSSMTAVAVSTSSVSLSPVSSTTVSGNPSPGHAASQFYIALYNYKPQKDDELELKKGEVYAVSEKCQDGWFKGVSIWTNQSGVFPGNYVHLAKGSQFLTQFLRSSDLPARLNSPLSARHKASATSSAQSVNVSVSNDTSAKNSTIVSAHSNSVPAGTRASMAVELLEWARSIAAMPHSPPRSSKHQISSATSASPCINKKQACQDGSPSAKSPSQAQWMNKSILLSPVPVSSSPDTFETPAASMAASYPSPSVNTHTQQNTSGFPSSSSAGSISQSWHSSGTISQPTSPCLSKLATPTSASPSGVSFKGRSSSSTVHHNPYRKHKDQKSKCRDSLMKRLTSKRKSRSPPSTSFSCDNPTFVDTTVHSSQPALVTIHTRSGSCPSEALGSTLANKKVSSETNLTPASEIPTSTTHLKQPVPLVRERFRCVVPYPPNSEYELELKVGDIVYVHKKREDGWYKGTLLRTGKTGLFPASFVDSY